MMPVSQSLLEQIVREVIQRFMQKPGLCLWHEGTREQRQLEELIQALSRSWQVTVWPIDPRSVPAGHHGETVLFVDADQDLIVRGAQGLTGTPASIWLADCLQAGIPVFLQPSRSLNWILGSSDGNGHLPESARRYREHILKSKEILGFFGAKFITETELLELSPVSSQGQTMKLNQKAATVKFENKLLTQHDVDQANAGEILISRSTIITPLARDAARGKGIEIRLEK